MVPVIDFIAAFCIIIVLIIFTINISVSISNEDFKKRDKALKEINETIQLLIKNNNKLKNNGKI